MAHQSLRSSAGSPTSDRRYCGRERQATTSGTLHSVIGTLSSSGYAATVARLTEAIDRRGLAVFARIDHAAAAREAGLELADEEVVVFGNPRAGTPLMQSDPTVGIELPLRMLIWSGADGVQLAYEDPRELGGRYDLSEHAGTLDAMAVLLAELAAEAAG